MDGWHIVASLLTFYDRHPRGVRRDTINERLLVCFLFSRLYFSVGEREGMRLVVVVVISIWKRSEVRG